MLSFLDRERSVAGPGFSRWLVPPAALAIHLCIGQVYALSVFKTPLVHFWYIFLQFGGDELRRNPKQLANANTTIVTSCVTGCDCACRFPR